jgi:Ni,Fe-hydrogenase III small subunit
MRRTLFESLTRRAFTEARPAPADPEIARMASALDAKARHRLGRGLSLRLVDAGSCNACELELNALSNPYYDLERFGLRFVASPRHADVLLITGPVTKNMREALLRTYNAMPAPKWVVAIGDCAACGGLYAESYACERGAVAVLPVDLRIQGCPPSPSRLLEGLLALFNG